MNDESENINCDDCEYYRPDGVFGQFPGIPGFPGMQPGFPGIPGFPGMQPGFPGMQPPFGPPPFGPQPGQPPFGPPPGGGPGGGPGSGPPAGPPPQFVPSQAQQAPGVFAVNPGAIRPCVFRYVYLWLVNGQQFWAWLVFVGRDSVAGWRWTGFNWIYFGIDLRQISTFVCY